MNKWLRLSQQQREPPRLALGCQYRIPLRNPTRDSTSGGLQPSARRSFRPALPCHRGHGVAPPRPTRHRPGFRHAAGRSYPIPLHPLYTQPAYAAKQRLGDSLQIDRGKPALGRHHSVDQPTQSIRRCARQGFDFPALCPVQRAGCVVLFYRLIFQRQQRAPLTRQPCSGAPLQHQGWFQR